MRLKRRERRIRERAAMRALQRSTPAPRQRTAQAFRAEQRTPAIPGRPGPNRAAVRRRAYGPNGGPRP